MTRGGAYQGREFGAPRADLAPVVAAGAQQWAATDLAAGTILTLKADLSGVDKTLQRLNTMSPDLLARAEEITALKLQRGGSAREIAALGGLAMLTQRMSRGASEFLSAGGISSETAFQLGRDTTVFRNTVDGFLTAARRSASPPRASRTCAKNSPRSRRLRAVSKAGDGDPRQAR